MKRKPATKSETALELFGEESTNTAKQEATIIEEKQATE